MSDGEDGRGPTGHVVATYRVRGCDDGRIAEVAGWMAEEMTIEFPAELVTDPVVVDDVLGRVRAISPPGDRGGCHTVTIAVPADVVAGSLVQLLSVVWGNVGLAPGVDLVGLQVPPGWVLPARDGARGIAAFRLLADAPSRPLTMSAVKPLGLPVDRLAALAGALAGAGLDVVKEDQSLADQRWAPFDARVGPIGAAVARANARSGMRAVYAPSLNGPVLDLPRRAALARDAGAGAVMVQPGISGLPAVAAASTAGLPVIAHPGGLGGMTDRVAAHLVHGVLPRLAGADCSIVLTPGGRFAVEASTTADTIAACVAPADGLPAILPALGGGITVERVGELRDTYGDDICLLIGGDLHRTGDPSGRAAALRTAVER